MRGGQPPEHRFVPKNWFRLSQECGSAVAMIDVELSSSRFRRSLWMFGRPARGIAYGVQGSQYSKPLPFPSLYPSSVYQIKVIEDFLSESEM